MIDTTERPATETATVPSPRATPQDKRIVVAIYDTHFEAEQAVRKLQSTGSDMKRLSILGKDYQTEENVIGYYNTGDRMMAWGKSGAFWGGIWGLLFGSAIFLVPGIGPLLAAGPVVSWILSALQGAVVVGGLSALGAGLYGIGIPKDSVLACETHVRAGKFVVMVHGTLEEAARDRAVLAATMHQGIEQHNCCA